MVIKKLHIEGYGKLKNISLDFHNGMNMLYGMNEAGKTTLKRCVIALLYGQKFSSEGVAGPDEQVLMKPWDGTPYRAVMTYSLDNGKTFTVKRDFEKDQVVLLDSVGRDITSNFPTDEFGEPAFAREHLGITRSSFLSSALIQHDQMTQLEDPHVLSSRIMLLADSASEEHSFLNSLEKLKKASAEIGSEENLYSPLGEVAAIVKSAQISDQESEGKKKEIEKLESKLFEKEEILRKYSNRWKILSFVLRKDELDRINSTIEDLEKLEDEIKQASCFLEKASKVEHVSLGDVTELHKRWAELEIGRKELEDMENRRTVLMEKYQKVRELLNEKSALIEVDKEILELVNIGVKDEAKEAIVKSKEEMIENARIREASAKELYEKEHKIFSTFKNAEEYEDKVSTLEAKVNKKNTLDLKESEIRRMNKELEDLKIAGRQRFLVAILVMLSGGFVSVFSLFQGVFEGSFNLSSDTMLFGLGVAMTVIGVLLWLTKSRINGKLAETLAMKEAEELKTVRIRDEINAGQLGLKELFKTVGALSPEELRQRYRDYIRAKIDVETATNLVKALAREIEAIKQDFVDSMDLQDCLLALGYLKNGDKISREAVLKFREDWLNSQAIKDESEVLRAEYERFMEEKGRIDDRVREQEKEIEKILSNSEVQSLEEYEEIFKLSQQADSLKANYDSLLEKKKFVAGDKTIDDLYVKRRQLQVSLEMLMEEIPEPDLNEFKNVNPDYIRNEYEAHQSYIIETKSEIAGLEFKIDLVKGGSISDSKSQEIQDAREKYDRLIKHKKALELALDMVSQTGRDFRERFFAPQLTLETAKLLKMITQKYEEIVIDKNLGISVKSPERDGMVRPENLSKGTIDQLYFALRLGMTRILSIGKETLPLLLDDPFIKFDEFRTKRAFKSLMDIDKIHQVMFFTCFTQLKQELAKALKRNNKVAKLYRLNTLELIKPAVTVEPPEAKKSSWPASRGTSFLTPPPGMKPNWQGG